MGGTLAGERVADATPGGSALLEVRDLAVAFPADAGPPRIGEVRAVDGIGYDIAPGASLGVVGESGCGKTVAALALLRLVPPPGRIAGGTVRFDGVDLLSAHDDALRAVRGDRIAMIFQEPMTALNPVFTVGDQIAEVLATHRGTPAAEAWEQAVGLLDEVGIPAPAQRAHAFPHSLSGGMRQRVMIAIALACRPALLIADEPTTALDVTIQAQILDLLLGLQDAMGMAIQFISHDLGVVSEVADEIVVMYDGRIVERAPADALFHGPIHPYTRALLETLPRLDRGRRRLPSIPGAVPTPGNRPRGCRFRNRCPIAEPRCADAEPALETLAPGHQAACLVAAAETGR